LSDFGDSDDEHEEDRFLKTRKQLRSLEFILNSRENFDLFYKENALVKNLTSRILLGFVFYNWVQAIFIYSALKYAMFAKFKSANSGYNLSNFESTLLIMVSLFTVTSVRTLLFFLPTLTRQNLVVR
jgi:hypothetical protein